MIPLHIHLRPINKKFKPIVITNGKLDCNPEHGIATIYDEKYNEICIIKNVKFSRIALTGKNTEVAFDGTIGNKKYYVFTDDDESVKDQEDIFSDIDIEVAFSKCK